LYTANEVLTPCITNEGEAASAISGGSRNAVSVRPKNLGDAAGVYSLAEPDGAAPTGEPLGVVAVEKAAAAFRADHSYVLRFVSNGIICAVPGLPDSAATGTSASLIDLATAVIDTALAVAVMFEAKARPAEEAKIAVRVTIARNEAVSRLAFFGVCAVAIQISLSLYRRCSR
jgi:hypothetical protein